MPKKVTDLTEKTTAISYDDVIHLIDVSDTVADPAGTSYKMKVGVFLTLLGVGIEIPGWEGYQTFKASGNTDLTQPETGDRMEGTGAYFSGDFVIVTVLNDSPAGDSDFNTPLFRATSI